MPVIATASSKGGAGKTTTTLQLALALAKSAPTAIIDADPNKPVQDFKDKTKHMPADLTVISEGVDEDTIADIIEDAASKYTFVLVDLEGTAAKIVVMAIGRADFVLIPTQGSALDAKEAVKTLRMIRQHENSMRRHVPGYVLPHALVMTRTNPVIRTRNTKDIEQDFLDVGVQIFRTELHEREAFKSSMRFNEPLEHLDPALVSNIDKAIANVQDLAAELVEALRGNFNGKTLQEKAA
jgi:chromosome partitioning protein